MLCDGNSRYRYLDKQLLTIDGHANVCHLLVGQCLGHLVQVPLYTLPASHYPHLDEDPRAGHHQAQPGQRGEEGGQRRQQQQGLGLGGVGILGYPAQY